MRRTSGQESCKSFHAATEARGSSELDTEACIISALESLQIVQEVTSQFTGIRLPKSTSLRRADGSFADNNWIEKRLAERLFNRFCNPLLDENCPLSNFFLASNTGLLSVNTIPGLPVNLV